MTTTKRNRKKPVRSNRKEVTALGANAAEANRLNQENLMSISMTPQVSQYDRDNHRRREREFEDSMSSRETRRSLIRSFASLLGSIAEAIERV